MRALKLLGLVIVSTVALQANPYQVTIDTSSLSGDYQVYMNLNGTTGNSVTASGFDLGGGSPLLPVVVGTGDLSSSVTLDTFVNPFVEFAQNFTVGSTLSFVLDLTNNGPAALTAPDTFAFALATTGNVNVPTNDPFGTDYWFVVSLTGDPLSFETFSTTSTSYPAITPSIVPTPEPASGAIVLAVLLAGLGVRRVRRAYR